MGALCRFAHASGRHPASSTVAGITGMYCAFSSIISSHHQYIMIISLVTNLPSSIHDSLHISTFSRALSVGRARRPPRGARHEKRDGTFSSPAGGQQNGRFNPFTRRRTDTARLTCAQPILHGGLEQGLSPGPIHHLIRRAVIAHVEIQTDVHERRRGPGLWPLTNLRQRLKVTLSTASYGMPEVRASQQLPMTVGGISTPPLSVGIAATQAPAAPGNGPGLTAAPAASIPSFASLIAAIDFIPAHHAVASPVARPPPPPSWPAARRPPPSSLGQRCNRLHLDRHGLHPGQRRRPPPSFCIISPSAVPLPPPSLRPTARRATTAQPAAASVLACGSMTAAIISPSAVRLPPPSLRPAAQPPRRRLTRGSITAASISASGSIAAALALPRGTNAAASISASGSITNAIFSPSAVLLPYKLVSFAAMPSLHPSSSPPTSSPSSTPPSSQPRASIVEAPHSSRCYLNRSLPPPLRRRRPRQSPVGHHRIRHHRHHHASALFRLRAAAAAHHAAWRAFRRPSPTLPSPTFSRTAPCQAPSPTNVRTASISSHPSLPIQPCTIHLPAHLP